MLQKEKAAYGLCINDRVYIPVIRERGLGILKKRVCSASLPSNCHIDNPLNLLLFLQQDQTEGRMAYIINDGCQIVGRYEYDEYDNLIVEEEKMAKINPLKDKRYHGKVYDLTVCRQVIDEFD